MKIRKHPIIILIPRLKLALQASATPLERGITTPALRKDLIGVAITVVVFLAIFGIGASYLALGQIHESGSGIVNSDSYTGYLQQDLSFASFQLEPLPTQAEVAYIPEPEPASAPAHKYVVTSHNGYIVVHYAAHESKSDPLRTATNISISSLAPEELERLAQGIHIYTEEALFRILEDYGS